jgi:GT2 family glycosyltransferase
MAQFSGLIPELDPYARSFNAERAARVTMARRQLALKGAAPGLSILVLHKDRPELLARLWLGFTKLRSVCSQEGIDVELLLGDTGSTNAETLTLLDNPPEGVGITRGMEYQFSRCNNDLFEKANYATVLFMNNDVFIDERPEGVVEAYRALTADPQLGAVGVVLLFEDGTVQHAGVEFLQTPELFAVPYHPGTRQSPVHKMGEVFSSSAVTGAFLMTSNDLFGRSGGFDERYGAECQDIDYCLRLRRVGFEIRTMDVGPIYHVENGTREPGEENWADRALFVRRWSSFVECISS